MEGRKYLSHGLEPLTDAERLSIETQIEDIEFILIPEKGDQEKKIAIITHLMLTLARSENQDPVTVRAKNSAYEIALAGIPAWAVEMAAHQWYRGSVPGVALAEFKWPPSPAMIRKASEDNMEPYRGVMNALRDVLEAKPLDETMQEIDTRGSA